MLFELIADAETEHGCDSWKNLCCLNSLLDNRIIYYYQKRYAGDAIVIYLFDSTECVIQQVPKLFNAGVK